LQWGYDPSSKGGPANRLRIMTTEELEEMEPGLTTRFDEEWERGSGYSIRKKIQHFRSEPEKNKK
jgi:hypothetical protein